MAWLAPTSRSHGGRSADSTSSGTAAVMGLQHGRMQVRDGRSGCGDDHRRSPRPARQPEREEPGGAFVDPHVQPEPAGGVGVVQGHRQRGVPGPGRQHGVA